jgi:hypothetical protein
MTNNPEGQTMLDSRTREILTAIRGAATRTPDLLPLLDTVRTLHDGAAEPCALIEGPRQ